MKTCVHFYSFLIELLTLAFSQPRFRSSRWYTNSQALYAMDGYFISLKL